MLGKIYLLNRKKKEINKNSLYLKGDWDQLERISRKLIRIFAQTIDFEDFINFTHQTGD